MQGIKSVVEKDSTLVTAKNIRGRCALHLAVLFGNVDIIEYLATANPISVNTPDNVSLTLMAS